MVLGTQNHSTAKRVYINIKVEVDQSSRREIQEIMYFYNYFAFILKDFE